MANAPEGFLVEVANQRLRLLTAALSSGSVWCFENLWLRTCTRRLLRVAAQLDKLLRHQKHLLCACVLVAIFQFLLLMVNVPWWKQLMYTFN